MIVDIEGDKKSADCLLFCGQNTATARLRKHYLPRTIVNGDLGEDGVTEGEIASGGLWTVSPSDKPDGFIASPPWGDIFCNAFFIFPVLRFWALVFVALGSRS